MSFDAQGRLLGGGNRPNQPIGWRQPPADTLHHMIDWAVLREFWNRMVDQRRSGAMERYLEIAGFAGEAQYAVRQVLGGRVLNLRIPQRHIYDSLAEALCWQCYNLFEGPLGQYRPVHSPDPTNIMQEFGHLGADTFDFPVVGPPHGFRANTLYRAYQQMTAYINAGSGGSPQPCLDLLEQISQLGVIRACDVNWFAIEKARFLALTPMQRRRFFDAGFRAGRWRPTDQQINQAYAQAIAS